MEQGSFNKLDKLFDLKKKHAAAAYVKPVKKSDGTDNDVATEIKKLHKAGGVKLT